MNNHISGIGIDMAQPRFLKLEDMFDMVTWTPNEEKFFVDMLIDYANNGKLFGDGCQTASLNEMVAKLSKFSGKTFSYKKVLKKFKSLRNRYDMWEIVTFWHGVHFNLAENKCEASESTWEAIIKEHPAAKKYKNEGEKLWCELSLIFGGQSSAEYLKTMQIKPLPENETIIVISDSDSNIGYGNCDELSCVGISATKPKQVAHCLVGPSYGKDTPVDRNSNGKLMKSRFDHEFGTAPSGVSSSGSSFWP